MKEFLLQNWQACSLQLYEKRGLSQLFFVDIHKLSEQLFFRTYSDWYFFFSDTECDDLEFACGYWKHLCQVKGPTGDYLRKKCPVTCNTCGKFKFVSEANNKL